MVNAKTSYKELLTEKQYLKMILANVINRLGDSIDLIAFQMIAYLVTGSATWMAVIAGVNFIPNLIFTPFTGVFVDRVNKKKLMVVCDIGRAAITLIIFFFYLAKLLSPWLLLLFTFANSTLETFHTPASLSIRTQILDKSKLAIGISANASICRMSEIAGLTLAGGIVAVSPAFALLLDSVSFLLSAIIISKIKDKNGYKYPERKVMPYFKQLKGGFQYLCENRTILYIVIFGALMNIAEAPISSFKTAYIVDILALGAWTLSLVSIAATLGMALGAVCSPRIYDVLKGRRTILFSGVLCGVVYIGLSCLSHLTEDSYMRLILITLFMFLYGLINGIIGVIYSTSLYSRLEDAYVGRLTGIMTAVTVATVPISSFSYAGLSIFMSIPQIFIIGAFSCFVIYSLIYFPRELKDL